jgi:type 1 glutamine amidotransferase
VGIVHLHQVIDYPAEPGQRALPWLGGVYVPGVGTRGHWDETFSTFPDHPVTRGVGPFTVNDGFILKLNWVEGMKGITPLMHTWNPKSKDKPSATDTIVAWTYDRPPGNPTPGMGGGRSFVFTGMHAHNEWAVESVRRLVTNGVLWAANVEIPSGGAPVALDPAEINKNLDIRVKPAPKAKAKKK